MDIKSKLKGLPTFVFNINLNTDMPEVRQRVKKSISDKPKNKSTKVESKIIDKLLKRIKSKPEEKTVYVKDGAQHIGGAV